MRFVPRVHREGKAAVVDHGSVILGIGVDEERFRAVFAHIEGRIGRF
jgi:hypothetical protein